MASSFMRTHNEYDLRNIYDLGSVIERMLLN